MLPEERRTQLDEIVGKMVANKESDDNIQFVVNDFKKIYAKQEQSIGDREKQIAGNLNPIQNVGVGIAKGVGQTIKGLGTLGTNIANAPFKLAARFGARDISHANDLFVPGSEASQKADELLRPASTGQTVGLVAEKIGESVLPSAKLGQLGSAVKGTKALGDATGLARFGSAATRVAGQTGVEGLGQAGLGYIQSGGDKDVALAQGAFSGVLKGAGSVLGETSRALNAPARIYQPILKDQQLSQEAAKRGISGTLQGMQTDVISKLPRLEDDVIKAAKQARVTIKSNPKLHEVLLRQAEKLDELADAGDADIARELAAKVKGGRFLNMEDALKVRRFLDKEISYTKSGIAPKGDRVLKSFADELRIRINSSDVGPIMKDYQFYIKMGEALRNEARRAGNREVIGLFDTILFGSGIGGDMGTGLLAAGTQKAARSTFGRTKIAQFLNNLPKNTTLGEVGVGQAGQLLGRQLDPGRQ